MPQPPAVPTLEDVAARAGVSTATVSRCLNAPDRVSEATRQRVMDAVRDLGYAPNFGARALAARRTNTVGAIIPTMENAIFARGLQAFQEELQQAGIMLLVASSSYDPALEEEQIRALVARGAEGLLLIGHDRTAQTYAFLETQGVPHVVAWVHSAEAPRPSIGFDNRAAMRSLTREVLALGHRRIAVISAERQANDRARERFAGICEAMKAQGLNADNLRLIETPYGIANGAEAFERLMSQTLRPSVVLCGNDVLAAGAVQRAAEMGISVPGDVSVTGFDDIDLAGLVSPGLTTVHVPHRDMGRLAAQALLQMVEEPGGMTGHKLETTITWRGSLGPAAPLSRP